MHRGQSEPHLHGLDGERSIRQRSRACRTQGIDFIQGQQRLQPVVILHDGTPSPGSGKPVQDAVRYLQDINRHGQQPPRPAGISQRFQSADRPRVPGHVGHRPEAVRMVALESRIGAHQDGVAGIGELRSHMPHLGLSIADQPRLVATAEAGRPPAGEDVYMLARLWEFWPILELKKGKSYRFHMSSADWQHGFSLQPTNINISVHPEYEHVITLTPTQSGTFGIVCNEFCGIGHHTMTGRIRVVD